ncbi:SDR family oxidoreductase [Pelagibius litoralis]|uniref:SDR family oxidoreductase n=1 Tax=Pelagibius litoralis TaxID=374515 RepID=A0A967CB36_9PROT|nr:SDR family NAD(P)-dependent oxidoreductase [Pelagibius litoralis]NIA67889.1 SDR family oxidoreductase [Pelagibius litoralis]
MTLALVTGIVGGIGAAIARRLADDGFDVVVSDRPGTAFDDAAAALGLPAYAADLGRRADVERLVAAITQAQGAPGVLVNSAGGVCGQVHQAVDKVSEEDWRAVFAANTDSAFFLAQALAPAMRAQGSGRIVTISSGAGLKPSLTGIQAYTAAKHALVGLTRQLALELGPAGITVNSVAPGFVLSNDATRRQWDSYGEAGQQAMVGRIHLRRLGQPEDIAGAVSFLAGADAAWITGQVLCVDGGHT